MLDRICNIYKTNKRFIIFMICIIGFILFARAIMVKEFLTLDKAVYSFIHNYLIKDNFTPIAKCFTFFGSAFALIIFSVLIILNVKNKKIKHFIPLNLIFITILNIILKNSFRRERPIDFRLIDETGYSFPSGHSMASMAFYGFLIYLIYKNFKNKYVKWLLISILIIVIFFIGLSRIYLGVHYTSDVLSGFLISLAYLTVFTTIYKKY